MRTVKLRLTVDVEYLVNGVNLNFLESALHNIADHAAGEGMMTDGSEAEVIDWKSRVKFAGSNVLETENEVP